MNKGTGQRRGNKSLRISRTICLTICLAATARAEEIKLGDLDVTVKGSATYGTAYRTVSRDPVLLPIANAAAIGVPGAAPGGRNSDDANLNYDKGDRISTVLKGVVDIDARKDKLGVFVRAKVWKDYALENDARPWGNIPNGYAAGQPLSDAGFNKRAKFSGAAISDANVYGSFAAGGLPVSIRAGNQNINWGKGMIGGGLAAIDPVDAPARVRPGAVSQEGKIAIPALLAKVDLTDKLGFEAFYQLAFRRSQLLGCGTFFAAGLDYMEDGCDKVVIGAGSDRTSLATGFYIKRTEDRDPSNSGQFGLSMNYRFDPLATVLAVYGANIHNRTPMTYAEKTRRMGSPFLPADPGGLNPTYGLEFPEDVHIFGATFDTRLQALSLYGEYTYLPNQPVRLNAIDQLNAFASATAATPLRAEVTALPLGASFHGYDRRKISQGQVGASKGIDKVMGAETLSLAGELGLRYMHDLPDPSLHRYGRSDLYGQGPVNGLCTLGASATQCSMDGYVSKFAWGYRLRASMKYAKALPETDITPSLSFTQDVRGWSYDGVFNEGRRSATLSLRAQYKKRYFAELAWTTNWGGAYSTVIDRDYAVAALGVSF